MTFRKIPFFGWKLNQPSFKYLRNILVVGSIICLILSVVHFIYTGFALPVAAVSTSLSSGTVSLDKYYGDANTEVRSLTTAPGGHVTVRLRYNNTAPVSALNTILSDSLPSAKFDFIPNTLQNCLINSTNCVALSDSLWSGQNLAVSTAAGFYGYLNSATVGNLELGRQRYAHLVTCSQSNSQSESFIQTINNTSIFVPSCATVSGSSVVQNYDSIQILGQRYLHQTVCVLSDASREIFTQSIDNNAAFTPDCSGFVGASVDSSSSLDLYSSANGSGYIEYQMKSNIVEDYNSIANTDIGEYGTNASLSSSSFTTLIDNMANSLSLKVFCDVISPSGGERNLNLSDAEIRAGQDFRCNYQASICPIVFEDINTNGVYNFGIDTLKIGVQILLQDSAGITTLGTITSNNTTQCFPNLLHGKDYRVNISAPPTGVSTTGGDTKNQVVSYRENQINVEFGYSNGAIILNVPPSVVLPAITVDSKPNDVSTVISPIQVIDTRLANPGWTLTATVNDFTSLAIPDSILRVANAFKNTPGTVIINNGQTSGIAIGNQKTIATDLDAMSIFAGAAGNSQGNYQINTNITLTVPSLTRATSYQSIYTYTII